MKNSSKKGKENTRQRTKEARKTKIKNKYRSEWSKETGGSYQSKDFLFLLHLLVRKGERREIVKGKLPGNVQSNDWFFSNRFLNKLFWKRIQNFFFLGFKTVPNSAVIDDQEGNSCDVGSHSLTLWVLPVSCHRFLFNCRL